MKKSILLLCSFILMSCQTKKNIDQSKNENQMPDEHTSMNALDWQGTYTGIVPCSDCPGIETVLTLKNNLHYTLQQSKQGEKGSITYSEGKFSWDKNGQIISLDQRPDHRYFVGENKLRKLNPNEDKNPGGNAQQGVLSKEFPKITGSHWGLIAINGQAVTYDKKRGNQPYFILQNSAENTSVVYGHSGCNKFSGSFEIAEGQRLRIQKLASTKMACANMDLEQRFLTMLNTIDNYSLRGDTLTLQKARMAPMAKFVKLYFQ